MPLCFVFFPLLSPYCTPQRCPPDHTVASPMIFPFFCYLLLCWHTHDLVSSHVPALSHQPASCRSSVAPAYARWSVSNAPVSKPDVLRPTVFPLRPCSSARFRECNSIHTRVSCHLVTRLLVGCACRQPPLPRRLCRQRRLRGVLRLRNKSLCFHFFLHVFLSRSCCHAELYSS